MRIELFIVVPHMLFVGNRFIRGDDMSLNGETVIDSHAEILARRALQRFYLLLNYYFVLNL